MQLLSTQIKPQGDVTLDCSIARRVMQNEDDTQQVKKRQHLVIGII
jgi:hypothetical protein